MSRGVLQRLTLIYNPMAGPANLARDMERVAGKWRELGWSTSVQSTVAVGHATVLARAAAEKGIDLVLAAGGDGTIGEVAAGLAYSKSTLGILPIGTANSFAQELHLPRANVMVRRNLLAASDALADGRLQRMDLGYAYNPDGDVDQGRYWLLWAGAGADGFLVSKVEPKPKWAKRIGRASYFIQGLPLLTQYSHVQLEVEIDRQRYEGEFILVLVSNCRRYAGGLVTLSPDATLDDGLFEVWLLYGRGLGSAGRHALHALRGNLDRHGVRRFQTSKVTIRGEKPSPLQLDGDPWGEVPITMELRRRALHFLAPSTTPADLFSAPGRPLLHPATA